MTAYLESSKIITHSNLIYWMDIEMKPCTVAFQPCVEVPEIRCMFPIACREVRTEALEISGADGSSIIPESTPRDEKLVPSRWI